MNAKISTGRRAASLALALAGASAIACSTPPPAAGPAQAGAPTAATPAGAANAPAGPERTLVVLNKEDGTASLVDLATMQPRATLPTGEGPHEVAVSPDGRRAAVANYGAKEPGHTLTLLDLERRAVAATLELGEHRRPHGIAWLADGRRLAVTSEASRALLVVDTEGGAVKPVTVGQEGTHMVALSPDRRTAYTANIKSSTVSMVDLERGAVVRTAPTPPLPEAIDVSPDGREVWAAPMKARPPADVEGSIVVLDARTLAELATFPCGGRMPNRLRFTPDGRFVLVSNAASGNVTMFDARARTPVATLALPRDPAKGPPEPDDPFVTSAVPLGILIAGDGRRAFVATAAHDEVALLDLDRRRVSGYLRTGKGPDGMAFSNVALAP
ncbi:MAG TPA: beta-propeller fold lactonase family protein [Polyangiaceae bacterium]|nr:beta-propeller fold lactonase family protein [Polyangiaceae bacterium]